MPHGTSINRDSVPETSQPKQVPTVTFSGTPSAIISIAAQCFAPTSRPIARDTAALASDGHRNISGRRVLGDQCVEPRIRALLTQTHARILWVSPLAEIIEAASDDDVSIPNLLRKLKVVASRLPGYRRRRCWTGLTATSADRACGICWSAIENLGASSRPSTRTATPTARRRTIKSPQRSFVVSLSRPRQLAAGLQCAAPQRDSIILRNS